MDAGDPLPHARGGVQGCRRLRLAVLIGLALLAACNRESQSSNGAAVAQHSGHESAFRNLGKRGETGL